MAQTLANVVETKLDNRVLTVSMNRPDSHNAMNPQLIESLTAVFESVVNREEVRIVVLTGNGRSFCAGADLAYMRAAADFEKQENVAGGLALFDLMHMIDNCPKPVIGKVNGAAIGGGVGLVSCCDIAIAVKRAKFGFSETRLGLVPAVISPFVLARIGTARGRELFLTGERFDAETALALGLVNALVEDETELEAMVQERVGQLLLAAPGAQAAAKELIRGVAYQQKEDVREFTAQMIADRRASEEGREGMTAFLEKRKPKWQQ